jgi:carbonic anhydrase
MERLVKGFLKFRTEVSGRKSVDLHGWVYDLDSERFTSLPDDAFPRLKASR